MKKAEIFLAINKEKIINKFGGVGDYHKLYSKSVVIELMKQFSEQENESLTSEIQDQEKLLVAFCWNLKEHDVTFSEDYTQNDFERIAYVFLNEDDNMEDECKEWDAMKTKPAE